LEVMRLKVIRSVIRGELGKSPPTVSDVAERLGISRRTLQRRLADEDCSYSQLLGSIRSERARRLLSKTNRPLYEIATSLGYSDAGSLSRAFQRWTGTTPSKFRRRNQ